MNDKESALSEHKENTKKNRIKKSDYWKYISLALFIILLVVVYTNNGSPQGVSFEDNPEAVDIAVSYLNDEMLAGLATAELVESAPEGDLFKLTLDVTTLTGESEEYVSYITKDGTLLFPAVVLLYFLQGHLQESSCIQFFYVQFSSSP